MDSTNSKTLVIKDTGIGIQSEDLPRVFEKGFTGYNGRTDKKSTGKGLYLCKRILTKLSHTITIESDVGSGTIIKIGLDTVKITAE
jgi:signal transduction histidine kinase